MTAKYPNLDFSLNLNEDLRKLVIDKFGANEKYLLHLDSLIAQYGENNIQSEIKELHKDLNKFRAIISRLETKKYIKESAKNIDQLIKYYSESPLKGDPFHWAKYCGDTPVMDFLKLGIELKGIFGNYLQKQKPNSQNKYIEDSEGTIDYFCLKDANEYFNKALYLMCCYKYLQTGGYNSWAKVTFYYPRFYLNNSLCRLQGYYVLYGKPSIELFRENCNNRVYAYKKTNLKTGPHVHVWETAKEYYKDFDSRDLISLSNEGIKSFFNDEFLKEIGIDTPSHTELNLRNEITYGATKFKELDWRENDILYSFNEGNYNYIDPEVYSLEYNSVDFGGEGSEEYGMELLIGFVMELLGKISNEIQNPNLCHIKMKSLRHFKTNEDFLNLIEEWAKEYGLSCE
jgi:hypothetical protein